MEGAIKAVRSIEDRFNRAYRYPYVFLNEEPFTDDFKRFVFSIFLLNFYLITQLHSRLSILSAAKMEFGLIPREHWFQPDSIDEEKASASRKKMMDHNIVYGGSVSYRNMCRYNSGVRRVFFYINIPNNLVRSTNICL